MAQALHEGLRPLIPVRISNYSTQDGIEVHPQASATCSAVDQSIPEEITGEEITQEWNNDHSRWIKTEIEESGRAGNWPG